MQVHEHTAISNGTTPSKLHPLKVREQFVDDVYSILKHMHLENFFHHFNNLHQNVKFPVEEESIDNTSEKLRRILKSHKIRSTFYIESTLRKLLYKPKERVAREEKHKIVYEIDCSNVK